MFDSGITAKELIEAIKEEADIALDIPDENYIQWLNSLEQLLYSEVIKEQKAFTHTLPDILPISLDEIDVSEGEAPLRYEDLHAVYVDDTQLIKSTVASGGIFPNTYYKDDNKLVFNVPYPKTVNNVPYPKTVKAVYFVRPALKTPENIDTAHVCVPVEFIELVKAKLRGEAYKLVNEDNLVAKYLNDYNVLLETFKLWITEKASNFGL